MDILVNNAGILSNNKAEATTDDEWRRVMAANLDGAFYWSRAVLPGMKTRGWGRIINVCSLAAKTGGLTAGTAYSTSKGALTSLTFSLAREAAAHGVTVNGISPAYVKTPMITEGLNEAQRRQLLSQIPVGRFCEPEEFAHAVRFLASPLAGFITGEILDVNGGLQWIECDGHDLFDLDRARSRSFPAATAASARPWRWALRRRAPASRWRDAALEKAAGPRARAHGSAAIARSASPWTRTTSRASARPRTRWRRSWAASTSSPTASA